MEMGIAGLVDTKRVPVVLPALMDMPRAARGSVLAKGPLGIPFAAE
jgi:hypothetical protein